MAAAATLPNPQKIIKEGKHMLDVRRSNYTETHPDPTHLQILWWEFCPEHWEDLR
jgi:hypothetical protein